jgi:PAS domain S-box-containing protein
MTTEIEQKKFLSLFFANSHFFQIFNNLHEIAFYLKDKQSRFIILNHKGCEICGVLQEKDAIGKSDYDFFSKEKADKYYADEKLLLQSGRPIINRVEVAGNQIGAEKLMMVNKIPIHDRKGDIIGLAGIGREIERLNAKSENVNHFAKTVDFLQKNYGKSITTPLLAKKAAMSVSQFERRFRRAFGSSPRQYLLKLRISGAAKLLSISNLTISEIAQKCGFYDQAHLCRNFAKLMKQTPSDYRKENLVG